MSKASTTAPKLWAPSLYSSRLGSTREEDEEEVETERVSRRGRPSFGEGSRFFANLAMGWRERLEGSDAGTLRHAAKAYGSGSRAIRSSDSASRLLVVRKTCTPFEVEILGSLSPEDSLGDFMRTQTVYDVLPTTSSLVLMDKRISLQQAFVAFVRNGVRCAPVWDAEAGELVSMLTLTDFLNMFIHAHAKGLAKPHQNTIHWWLQVEKEESTEEAKGLQTVLTTDSLYAAAKALVVAGVHRAPVRDADSGETVSTICLMDILKTLYRQIRSMPLLVFIRAPLSAVGGRMGSWGDVVTCRPTDELASAVGTILQHKVSSVAVVDSEGRLTDALSKSDVVRLLAEEVQAALHSRQDPAEELLQSLLHFTVGDAIELRSEVRPLPAVLKSESLLSVVERLVGNWEQRTLYVLDDRHRPVGAISTSDLVCFVLGLGLGTEAVAVTGPAEREAGGGRLAEAVLALDVRPEASSALLAVLCPDPAPTPTPTLMDTSHSSPLPLRRPASATDVRMEQ